MTIQQLEYILAVERYQHFGKAAEYCQVKQPTLSMMIQKLETELGTKIFDRTSLPVRPTSTGAKILRQARKIIHQTSLIKDIVMEEEQSLVGSFRLGVLPTIAPYLLPRFLQHLAEQHKELDIRIREMQTAPTLTALVKGDIDAAIIANAPIENDLQGTLLYYEEFFAYVSKQETISQNKMIRTSDIKDERLWLLDEGHCFRDQLMRFCQREQVKLHQSAYKFGSLETFMHMVENGYGITFIPELATFRLCPEQKELVRPFAMPRPTREIYFVTRKDFVRHALSNILIEHIREAVPQEMLQLKVGQRIV